MPYKTELHMHTGDISVCARVTPEEAVRDYKAAGYRTIVVTNHMNRATFQHMAGASWEEQIQWYVAARKRILDSADADFSILLGFELRLDGCENDYLVYGATDDFLLHNGDGNDPSGLQCAGASKRSIDLSGTSFPISYDDGQRAVSGRCRSL